MATMNGDEIIRQTLDLLLEPTAVAELRVLGVGDYDSTFFGYYDCDHRAEMAQAALKYSGKAGVYMTLNRLHDGLLARMPNTMAKATKRTPLTVDRDATARTWLPIDVDPIRPKAISSSDDERKYAWEVVINCRDWLVAQGWKKPLLADSGNGFHLLLRLLNMPNDDATAHEVSMILKMLADRFNNQHVAIDPVNYNAARVWKIFGTFACKGFPLPDRPHRLSRIIEIPEDLK